MPFLDNRRHHFRQAWAAPVAIFGVAFLLRLVFVLHLRESPLSDVPMRDEFTLIQWARSIAAGDLVGSEVFFRAPLYPYLLGAQLALFRGSLHAARVCQAVLGALVPVGLYFLGSRALGRREGFIAAAAAAVYPILIYFSNELLIVTPAVLLNVLMLLAVLRADNRPTAGRWLVVGLLLGLSAITRPNVLLFAPFLFVWMWRRARDSCVPGVFDAGDRSSAGTAAGKLPSSGGGLYPMSGLRPFTAAARRFALVALGAVLVISAVTIRNYAVSRDFVPIASQGGINFFIGNNPSADGASAMLPGLGTNWEYEDAIRYAEEQVGRSLKASEVSGFWYAKGMRFLAGSPGAAARLYLKKLVLFWDRHEIGSNKDIYHFGGLSPVFRAFSWLNFLLVAPLALLGMIVSVRTRPGTSLLTLFALSYMASVAIFFVNARFRLPTVPVLILLAVAGAEWLFRIIQSRDRPRLAAGVAFVCAAVIFVNADFYRTHVSRHAHTHYTVGLAYAWKGHLQHAVDEYKSAIGLWPNYVSAYDAMGQALEGLGRDEEALEAYAEAAKRGPDLADAPKHAGILLLRMGDMQGGIEWLSEAVRRNPSLADAHFYLASTLAGEGRFEEAERSFRSAIEADAGMTEAWNGLGRVLEDTGRQEEALRAYEKAISTDPGFIDAHNNIAVLLAKMGRHEESIARFEAALGLAPGDPKLRANLETVQRMRRAGD